MPCFTIGLMGLEMKPGQTKLNLVETKNTVFYCIESQTRMGGTTGTEAKNRGSFPSRPSPILRH